MGYQNHQRAFYPLTKTTWRVKLEKAPYNISDTHISILSADKHSRVFMMIRQNQGEYSCWWMAYWSFELQRKTVINRPKTIDF